ncbi:MMPL family transporter [Gordonia liuliyuniae]|uniref:Efflux RND transporter permease subunit n=1 Tax=Gordonia liuliyuniae TaxID=2911517 RepID=A0ABS9ITG6_9ACTN|nr:efflux RND transporter permease subunit [Gordonia liuliyuniae]MCF8588792.1 efflux RND transporter permease subunit [Gordonia liuliyuniae]
MTSRRPVRVLVPALALLVWLVLAAVTGPLAGKLSQVTTDDASAFLPSSAESTQVQALLPEFTDTEYFPAIVVAENTSGWTAADSAYLSDAVAPLQGAEDFAPRFSPPIVSDDGQAAQLIVPVATDGETADAVDKLQDALADPPSGVTVAMTGPAVQAADLSGAFAGIDGILLLVAGVLVLIILVVVYRSPILPIIVLLSAVFGLALACGCVYALADSGALELNGQSQGILFILVFGAATDYALLLVARYREHLTEEDDPRRALMTAWRATLPPIAASAGTVILGVLCLLFSDLNSNRSLGPIAAIGVAASFLVSITFLPAALALLGRTAFWPRRPTTGDTTEPHRLWKRVADMVAAAPRRTWAATLVILIIGAAFAPMFRSDGVATTDFFLGDAESVTGAELHDAHFDAGAGSPTWVIAPAADADQAAAIVRQVPGVASADVLTADGAPVVHGADGTRALAAVQATLADDPDSLTAQDTVVAIRDAVGEDVMVGGPTAIDLDTRVTARHDRNLVIPLVLIVVLAVLILLLRSLAAPLLLLGTTVLSFATTLGVGALLFNGPFDFPGADPVVPLFAFVFLVALGVDYNIFLMTRAREEAGRIGTRDGMLSALTSTGGVISAAGIVLAATFAALAVIPLLFLAQVAFLVAFGVLVDTLIVRSLLVPAVTLDVGRRIWFPSKLSKE